MMRLKFVLPTLNHYQEVMSFKEEFFNNEEYIIPGSALLDNLLEYAQWLDHIETLKNRDIELDDWVHSDVYLVYDIYSEQLIGIIDLRDEISEKLPMFYGQIGYSIRPSRRKQSYGKEMLELGLSEMKDNNHTEVIICCERDNVSSKKILEKNGGIHLRDEVISPDQLVSVYIFRF